jgi:hypothetical protein
MYKMEKTLKINNKIHKYANRALIRMWAKVSLTHLRSATLCLTTKTKNFFTPTKRIFQILIQMI